jgi:hypothetical protein
MAALLIAWNGPEPRPGVLSEMQAVAGMLVKDCKEELAQDVWQAVQGAPPGPAADMRRCTLEAAVQRALAGSVASELRCAAGLPSSERALRPLRLALHASMQESLACAPRDETPLREALLTVVSRAWYRYIWGHRRLAFGLLLDDLYGSGDLRARERAYRCAVAGACCWYPHRQLLVASE